MSGVITSLGKNQYINRMFESSPTQTKPQYIQLGMCSKTPVVTDTKVISPLPISTSNVAIIDACDSTSGWSVSGDASAVTLNNTAGEYLEGTGCLNMPVVYSAGTSSWYKTVTGFDGTGDYYTWMLYISSLSDISSGSNACQIDLGTGGFANYNGYYFDKNILQVGWNALVCDIENPDSIFGFGATITNIDRIRLTITNATTWTTNDIRMDWNQTYPIVDTFTTFSSGYPSYNTSNKSVTLSGQDVSTSTNGYLIREIGVFNSDSPKKLYSRDTFTTINKSQFISLTFNQTDTFS